VNGGAIIAEVLERHGVEFLFTLCGGHISPILVEAKSRGIRVIDTRHEANAVFAADASARLTGIPGVAAVTAGPGVTNTVTAIKNAQMAHSPIVLLGGATAGILAGRGALQDIDQVSIIDSCVKRSFRARRVADLGPLLEEAFGIAQSGVPGPVFVECAVDLLYDESVVREWFGSKGGTGGGLKGRLLDLYVQRYLRRLYAGRDRMTIPEAATRATQAPRESAIRAALERLSAAKRPVLVAGSQVVQPPDQAERARRAIDRIGVPVYLAGAARGLLGPDHPLQLRHNRKQALKEADAVILAGVANDFRLDYGRQIRGSCSIIAANRSRHELELNRKPDVGAHCDPALFLEELSRTSSNPNHPDWPPWIEQLRSRDRSRDIEIAQMASHGTDGVNPLGLLRTIDEILPDDSTLVADGGDFVATAAYALHPRRTLGWLDPGPFGTLGVGAGFALAAKLLRPESEVWILYGDGSLGFSIAEIDTFVRHHVPVIMIVGNDGCWSQIAREQVVMLKDDVGCMLERTAYHEIAEGFGARGLLLDKSSDVMQVLEQARSTASSGTPVLVNAHIGATDFRKGSISM